MRNAAIIIGTLLGCGLIVAGAVQLGRPAGPTYGSGLVHILPSGVAAAIIVNDASGSVFRDNTFFAEPNVEEDE